MKITTFGSNDMQLYHNVPNNLANATSMLDAINVGTAVYQRIGNRIRLRKVLVNALLNNKDSRPNVTYRVVACMSPYSASTDTFGELIALTGTTPYITAPLYPGLVKILCDKYFGGGASSVTSISGTTLKERTFPLKLEFNCNADVQYDAVGVAQTRLQIFVIAYDAYGTLTTDNIASIPTVSVGLYFEDD